MIINIGFEKKIIKGRKKGFTYKNVQGVHIPDGSDNATIRRLAQQHAPSEGYTLMGYFIDKETDEVCTNDNTGDPTEVCP